MAPKSPAAYLRISKDKQGQALGVERQREDCIAKAGSLGWPALEFYIDNDRSASKANVKRDDYDRMMHDFKTGRRDGLVVYDLDRLTRRPIELEQFMDVADKYSVELANVSGDVDLTTSSGRMMARIKGAVARQEADRIGERVARQAQQWADMGIPHKGRYRPFGYTKDYEVIKSEATMIQEAYSRAISGESLMAICDDWNAKGKLTTTGVLWRRTTLRQMLDKPLYAGIRAYRGKRTDTMGLWEACIDVGTYELYVGVREANHQPGNGSAAGHNARKHLLSGLARCGRCGTGLLTNQGKLVCRRSNLGCGSTARKEEPVRQHVVELFLRDAERNQIHAAEVPAVDHTAEIRRLEAQLEEYRAHHEAGALELGDFIRFSDTTRGKLRALMGESAKAVQQARKAEGDLRQKWDEATLSARRAMLRERIEAVVIKPFPEDMRGRNGFHPDLVDIVWAN